MTSINSGEEYAAMQERSRRSVKLANEISSKVEQLGMSRPRVVNSMGANLSCLYGELERCTRLIDQFLAADTSNLRVVGEILVDMKVSLMHMTWCIQGVRRALERVIDYCYAKSDSEEAKD
jgi:hypothetical protein